MSTVGEGITGLGVFNSSSQASDELLRKSGNFAIRLVAELEDYDTGDVVEATAESVTLTAEGRSSAICSIQFSERFETYPTISAMHNSPAKSITGGALATIKIQDSEGAPLLIGHVVKDTHQLDQDAYTFEVEDGKFLMAGVYVYGRFVWDPIQKKEVFDQATPTIFNENGKPNCYLGNANGPLFAPYSRFGSHYGENAWYNSPNDKDAAIPWTLSNIMEYLRNHYYGSAPTAVEYLPGYHWLDGSTISWPPGLSSALLTQTEMSNDNVSGVKDQDLSTYVGGYDINIQGMHLEAIFNKIASMAGAYGFYLKPKDNGQSEIAFVPLRYQESRMYKTNAEIYRRTGTLSTASDPHIISGAVERDFREAYSSVMVLGDRVYEDIRVAFDPTDIDSETDWKKQQLQPAYTANMLTLFRNFINSYSTYPKTVQAFRDGVHLFPMVLSGYKIMPNPTGGTGEVPTANTTFKDHSYLNTPMKVLDHLLSWTVDTTGVSANSLRRFLHVPIFVEVKILTGYNTSTEKLEWGDWIPITELNGFEVDDQNVIYFPGLRETGLYNNQHSTWVGSIYDPLGTGEWLGPLGKIRLRPMRLTIAVGLDYRNIMCTILSGADRAFKEGADPIQTTKRIDPAGEAKTFSKYFVRQYVVDTKDAYKLWMRKATPWPDSIQCSSIPVTDGGGDLAGGEANASKHDPTYETFGIQRSKFAVSTGYNSGFLLDDGKEALAHATRRMAHLARPTRTSEFIFPYFVLNHPGTIYNKLSTVGTTESSWDIKGVIRKVTYNYRDQSTTFDLG